MQGTQNDLAEKGACRIDYYARILKAYSTRMRSSCRMGQHRCFNAAQSESAVLEQCLAYVEFVSYAALFD
jgi:hypothetical protein